MIQMPIRLSDIDPASWYYAGGMGPCCWRHLGVPGPWPVQGGRKDQKLVLFRFVFLMQ